MNTRSRSNIGQQEKLNCNAGSTKLAENPGASIVPHQDAMVWSLLPSPLPPSLTIITYEMSSKGTTSAEANPKEADIFRLSADFIPHSWVARPSWEGGWSSTSLPCHRKYYQPQKDFKVFLALLFI